MNPNKFDLREPQAAEGLEMIGLMREGVVDALREHKSKGRSVIAWDREKCQVVEIESSEIIIPDDPLDLSPG